MDTTGVASKVSVAIPVLSTDASIACAALHSVAFHEDDEIDDSRHLLY